MATPKYIVNDQNKEQKLQSGVDQTHTKEQVHQQDEGKIPGFQPKPENVIPVPDEVAKDAPNA
ncbi:hypothetical protein EON77_20690 [bacterium]|nr:MAG: hypothetical protein EON77_20690 [bacterium]